MTTTALEYERNSARGIHADIISMKMNTMSFSRFYDEDFGIKDFHEKIRNVVDYSIIAERDIQSHLENFNKIKKDFDRKAHKTLILELTDKAGSLQLTVKRLRDTIDSAMNALISRYYEENDTQGNERDLSYIKGDLFKDRFDLIRELVFETEENSNEYVSKFKELFKEDQKLRWKKDNEIEVNSETPSF